MKFKIGDKVEITDGIYKGEEAEIVKIDISFVPKLPYLVQTNSYEAVWKHEDCIELVKPKENTMRKFDTGATRDSIDHPEKPSYYKGLSPIVLREYMKYLGRHREMSDGSKRDWDNWKKGIDLDVYADGLLRHAVAVWLILQGYKSYDNNGEVNLKDSLNGVMFAANGMLHEVLKDDVEKIDRNKPVDGDY